VKLFRGQHREAIGEVKPHLVSEAAEGSGARPVVSPDAVVEQMLQEFVVGAHDRKVTATPAIRRPRIVHRLLKSQAGCGGAALR
jgi:hypothetical protein